jgi:hypothetical protein
MTLSRLVLLLLLLRHLLFLFLWSTNARRAEEKKTGKTRRQLAAA